MIIKILKMRLKTIYLSKNLLKLHIKTETKKTIIR